MIAIVKNANAKMRMLHIASKFIGNIQDLLHIYKTFIRSRLEFSSVVWHSRLSKKNENDIERVQKSAVKLIMKENHSDNKNGLKTLGIETLFERREKLCLKFPKKMFRDRKF